MNSIKDKVVLITGGARGIGWGIASRFAGLGCKVAILDTGYQENVLHGESQDEIWRFVCDVTDEASVRKSIEMVVMKYNRLDILINNAGIQHVALIEDFPVEKFRKLIDVMLTGSFLTIKYAVPYMKKQRYGRIVNMSSINGLIGFAGKSAYNTAKHGLLGLTKVTALEGADYGITANAVCPGYVDTEMVRGQLKDLALTRNIAEERVLEEVIFPLVPQKRLITIEEVAELVVYLTYDLAGGITGQSIVIDGGYTVK